MSDEIPFGLPDKFELIKHNDYLEIIHTWRSWVVFPLFIFCLFWNGFLVVWYQNALAEGDLMMLLFPILHLAAGVAITYFAIATWFNKTHIYVSQEKIAVIHRPLPWVGRGEYMVAQLQQIYVKRRITHNKNSTRHSYEVQAVLKNGKYKKLLSSLAEEEQSFYLEQELERYLNMKDQRVKGEYRP